MNRSRAFKVAATLAALGLAGAPGQATAQAGDDTTTVERVSQTIPVHVTNYNLLDVNVYVRVGGQAYRLGTVTSFGSADFVLPAAALSSSGVQLVADPIGQRGNYASEQFYVVPGQQVDWTIENNPVHSTVWVS